MGGRPAFPGRAPPYGYGRGAYPIMDRPPPPGTPGISSGYQARCSLPRASRVGLASLTARSSSQSMCITLQTVPLPLVQHVLMQTCWDGNKRCMCRW